MKGNLNKAGGNKWHQLYFWGICIILCLPILTWSPLFFPPDWGKTIVFRMIMSVLLFAFCWQFLYQKDQLDLQKIRGIKKNKVAWLLLALLLVYIVSTFFSVDINFSLWGSPMRSGGLVNFSLYILFAFLVFFVSEKRDYIRYFNASAIMADFICLIAIIQYYSLFSNIFVATPSRPSATIGNPIFFGIYLLLHIFVCAVLAMKSENRYWKLFYSASSALFFVSILISGSRACWLASLIAVLLFLLFYPKKIKYVKAGIFSILALAAAFVVYSNTIDRYPQFLEDNKIFNSVHSRTSIKEFLGDARFPAWEAGYKAVMDKPLFGWGIENFYVGFDRHFFSDIGAEWWDRAHNVLIQTAGDAGIPAMIIYIGLFGAAIRQLQRCKKDNPDALLPLALQATLIAYLIANFFSIDCCPTYIISFFMFSMAMQISQPGTGPEENDAFKKSSQWHKPVFLAIGGLAFAIFMWQYNILPLMVMEKVNESISYVDQKKCDDGLAEIDDQLKKHTFADFYVMLRYVNELTDCAGYYPEKNTEYAQKGVEIMKETVKIQPLYSRMWIALGGFTTSLAKAETDEIKRQQLVQEAIGYFDKAEELTPGHQLIQIQRAKLNNMLGNYQEAIQQAEKCISLGENYGECYWVRATSEIYLGQDEKAEEDLETAREKNFDVQTVNYYELIDAYSKSENYQKLAEAYEGLIKIDPNIAEYHSSLAFAYYQLKEYEKARQEALRFGELMPEAADEVEAFLKLLPQ